MADVVKRDQELLDRVDDELLMPAQVAARFGVTSLTVKRWAVAGKLRAVEMPGGQRRYWRSEIDRIAPSE